MHENRFVEVSYLGCKAVPFHISGSQRFAAHPGKWTITRAVKTTASTSPYAEGVTLHSPGSPRFAAHPGYTGSQSHIGRAEDDATNPRVPRPKHTARAVATAR